MHIPHALLSGLTLCAALLAHAAGSDTAAHPDTQAPGHYTNPVIRSNVPDPTLLRADDGRFYLFGTGRKTPVYRSDDLVTWTRLGDAFTDAGRPSFVEKAGIWAPDINRIGDRYVLYYAMSRWGGEWECGIGAAVSDAPGAEFRTVGGTGKLFNSSEIGVQNSIDPCYVEENGRKYLFWGSFRGIYATELTDDGLALRNPADTVRVAGTAFEAVYVHRRGGYYYLFASVGTCCEGDASTYEVVVGRSKSLLGPYVDRRGGKMLENHATRLLHGDASFAGPGHNSRIVTDDEGRDWILYHAYERGRSDAGRQVLLDRVEWVDGWPVIGDGTPSRGGVAPVL